MTGLFFDDADESISPTMTGGSAGLNSAMFFACPACGAVVLDMHYERVNRDQHEAWHASRRRPLVPRTPSSRP